MVSKGSDWILWRTHTARRVHGYLAERKDEQEYPLVSGLPWILSMFEQWGRRPYRSPYSSLHLHQYKLIHLRYV